ncbi:hypothetical protein DBR23_22845, partial [Acidovorax sp. HMWF018]
MGARVAPLAFLRRLCNPHAVAYFVFPAVAVGGWWPGVVARRALGCRTGGRHCCLGVVRVG